jgi:anti-sigma B factor antagonist
MSMSSRDTLTRAIVPLYVVDAMAVDETESSARVDLHTAQQPDGSVTVAVSGEVDLSNTGQLAAALTAAGREALTGRVTLDLAGLRFIDSAGLRVLLVAAREALGRNRRLVAVNTPAHVRRLFELTALDQTLDVRP